MEETWEYMSPGDQGKEARKYPFIRAAHLSACVVARGNPMSFGLQISKCENVIPTSANTRQETACSVFCSYGC